MIGNVTFETCEMYMGIEGVPNGREVFEVEFKVDILMAILRSLIFSFLYTLSTSYCCGMFFYMSMVPEVGKRRARIISVLSALMVFYMDFGHHFVFSMVSQTKLKFTDMHGTDHDFGDVIGIITNKIKSLK